MNNVMLLGCAKQKIYSHMQALAISLFIPNTTVSCYIVGCGVLYVADGNWKLKYAHCMWHVPIQVQGFNKPLNYPSICPLSPERGMAFCKEHCSIASESGLPTGLQDFLKCCSTKEKPEGNIINLFVLKCL